MKLEELVASFIAEVSRMEQSEVKTGMQVPYHGDWAGAPPSTRKALKWWAMAFQEALEEET